eukprot:bmy_00678T0
MERVSPAAAPISSPPAGLSEVLPRATNVSIKKNREHSRPCAGLFQVNLMKRGGGIWQEGRHPPGQTLVPRRQGWALPVSAADLLTDMGEDTAASPDPSVTREEGQRGTGALSRTRFYPRSHNTPTSIKYLPTAQGPWSGGEVTQPRNPKGLDLTLTPILRRTPTEGECRAQALLPPRPTLRIPRVCSVLVPRVPAAHPPNPLPGAEKRTAMLRVLTGNFITLPP